jgi:hypothetical protein
LLCYCCEQGARNAAEIRFCKGFLLQLWHQLLITIEPIQRKKEAFLAQKCNKLRLKINSGS